MRKNGGATDINENLNDIKNVTATVVGGTAAAVRHNYRKRQVGARDRNASVAGRHLALRECGTRGREGGRRAIEVPGKVHTKEGTKGDGRA